MIIKVYEAGQLVEHHCPVVWLETHGVALQAQTLQLRELCKHMQCICATAHDIVGEVQGHDGTAADEWVAG